MTGDTIGRLWGVMIKEFRQVSRDTRSLGLLIFLPALMIMLYGYALTFDVKHIKTVVLDYDRSQTSHDFANSLFHSEYFDLVATIDRERDADQWLNSGRARVVMIIPADFGEKVNAFESVSVQMLVDGVNANSASIAVGYLQALARQYTMARTDALINRMGGAPIETPISVQPRVWYNPTLESSQFLIPGIIGFLLMLVGAVATALSVVREKERGTMEQISVSPVRSGEFILGKTIPYLLICILTTALIIATAVLLFDMPLRGSLFWLFVSTVVYLAGALGWGLVVSTISDTQQVAFMIATISTMLPALILSGLIFPISSMPPALQYFSYMIPPRHFIVIMRSVILKGTGPAAWTEELLVLTAFAVLMIVLASGRMRKGQAQ